MTLVHTHQLVLVTPPASSVSHSITSKCIIICIACGVSLSVYSRYCCRNHILVYAMQAAAIIVSKCMQKQLCPCNNICKLCVDRWDSVMLAAKARYPCNRYIPSNNVFILQQTFSSEFTATARALGLPGGAVRL